jgi:hypothetical protein
VLLRGKRLLVVCEDDALAAALVAAAVAAGAATSRCGGGRAALDEIAARGADGAVVELPLRDVRGDAFLIALRDRGIACAAVSRVLKGARYAEVARQFGAVGFFEERAAEAVGAVATEVAQRGGAEGNATANSNVNSTSSPTTLSPLPSPSPGGGDGDPKEDFDSLIFSQARPALDDTIPGLPLAPPPALAMPLPAGPLDRGVALARSAESGLDGLDTARAALLESADGTKTIADLLALARLPEREALAFLEAARDAGILREVPRVLAGTRRIGFM